MTRRIKVTKSDPPESTEVLAEAIVKIGKAADDLRRSGLNEEAIVVLLNDKTKVGKPAIRTVLGGLRQLRSWYCRDSATTAGGAQ